MPSKTEHIVISTFLESCNYLEVYKKFDEQLFRALLPKFPKVVLNQFDGSTKGDKVVLDFYLGIRVARWVSRITADWVSEADAGFVDEGEELPFPLVYWRHQHIVEKADDGCVISDAIEFSAGPAWLNALLLPLLRSQFAERTALYKKYFSEIR